jgi:hypothetical protein
LRNRDQILSRSRRRHRKKSVFSSDFRPLNSMVSAIAPQAAKQPDVRMKSKTINLCIRNNYFFLQLHLHKINQQSCNNLADLIVRSPNGQIKPKIVPDALPVTDAVPDKLLTGDPTQRTASVRHSPTAPFPWSGPPKDDLAAVWVMRKQPRRAARAGR